MDESDQQKPKIKKKKKVKKKKGKKEGTSSTTELNIPNVEVLKDIKDFFNQAPPKPGEQWTDDIFPPNKNSLINDSPKSNDDFECEDNDIDISEIEWKRISEIYPEPRLFSGKINAQEITNGKISSSYFLSAISAICDYPGLIKNIFINKEYNPDGYYTLVLFIDGEYKTIYLDDYFPCLKGTNIPYFTKVNNFSFWPLLLEKAWAKINGSYQNALSGWPNDIFRAFTGFACEELNHSEETPERIWRIIKTVKENNGIICTSTKIGEGINEVGLIPGISYSVINAVEVEDEKNRKIFLLKLRNDLGNSVWNGDWSENSVYWTDNIKKQIPKEEKTDKNKGEFYICLNDYISYFSRTDLCNVIYDGFKQTYDFNNISNIIYPHVFNFYLYEKSIVSISAIEKNWRFHKELRNISHPTSIVIAEYDPIKEKLQYITCSYESYENTEKTRVLNPGHYIAWIYKSSQSEKPLPESMKIRIISSGELNLKYIGNDQNFDIIEHIIYQGIQLYKDDKITLGEIFYDISSDFKRSGLGYRLIINTTDNALQNWEIDTKDNKGYYLLSENPNENIINFEVNPNDYECVVFIRDKKYGNFRLNLTNTVKQYDCNPNQKREKDRKKFSDFCKKSIRDEEKLKADKTPTLEKILNNEPFEEIDYEKIFFEKNNFELNNEILKLSPMEGTNRLGLIKLETDDGIYIGEADYATPHGRGCYSFKNSDQVWIGYFENGKKGNYGKFYDKGKLVYEGEYLNGEKNGKGVYYYEDGMKYDGEFVGNKKEGKGIFYWDEKTKWEGNWINDKMSGEGLYKDEDDEYMINFGEDKNDDKDENEIFEERENRD